MIYGDDILLSSTHNRVHVTILYIGKFQYLNIEEIECSWTAARRPTRK